MNKVQYHILNGDALKEQFPDQIAGVRLVARECLVDGDVQGATIQELFETRAKFISQNYGDYTIADYQDMTVAEFEKIMAIPAGAEVCLWFEDDLFCQVNFWFVVNLLRNRDYNFFLVRPASHTSYGFGGLNRQELIQAFENRKTLTELDKLAQLWPLYQQGDVGALQSVVNDLKKNYPFLDAVVRAYKDSQPGDPSKGKPVLTLLQIKQELKTSEFGPIFREFCKREPIYGYGDLQVRRLLDSMDRAEA